MKTIQIHGSYHQIINEDSVGDWFSSFMKPGGFFGNLCSNILGKPGTASKEATSEYEKVRQEGIKAFKDQREKEIKAKIEHRDKLRAAQLKAENTKKLNQMKAKEAEREQERKDELSRINRINKELEQEGNRIAEWTGRGAPKNVSELQDILNTCDEIAQQLPDKARMANNLAGILHEMCYDKDGNFIEKQEDREQHMKDTYGENWREQEPFNDSEIKSQIESFEAKRDKDYKDLADATDEKKQEILKRIQNDIKNDCLKVIPGYSDNVKTPEDEQNESDVLAQAQKAYEDHESKVLEAKKKLDEAEEQLKELNKIKEGIEKADNAYKDAKDNFKLQDALKGLYKENGKDDQDNKIYELDPSSNAYKLLKNAGIDDDKIKNLAGAQTGDAAITNIIKNLEDNKNADDLNNLKEENAKSAKAKYDKKVAENPDIDASIDAVKKAINGEGENTGLKQKYENAQNEPVTVKIKVENDEGKEEEKELHPIDIKALCGNISDPKALSSETIKNAIEKRNSEKEAREKRLESQIEVVKKTTQKRAAEEEREKWEEELKGDDTFKSNYDDITAQTPKLSKDDNDDIKITLQNDKEITIKKDDELYNAVKDNPNLFIDPGKEPEMPSGEGITDEQKQQYLKDHKQWELNTKALQQAKDIAYQNNPKSYQKLQDDIKNKIKGEDTTTNKNTEEQEPKSEPQEPKSEPQEQETEDEETVIDDGGSEIIARKKKNGKGSTYVRKKDGKEMGYATKQEFIEAKKRAQQKEGYQLKSLKSFLLESLKK